MSERLEKLIGDLGTTLNTRLTTIDTTLREKQIADAGRFATIEAATETNAEGVDANEKKISTHVGEHAKWVLYPVAAVVSCLGLAAFIFK